MGKTAIFGGTFNPIHNGHLKLIEVCCKAMGIEKAVLIPANVPPHKATQQLAPNADRLAMCQIAAKALPCLSVSDMELNAEGKSYTVLTMRRLKQAFPDEKFYFVMGTDMFLSFDRWYHWQEILDYCDLCVSVRRKNEYPSLERKRDELYAACPGLRADCIHTVEADCIEISSTELRRMLADGNADAKRYLPAGVYDYIREHRLYEQEKEG